MYPLLAFRSAKARSMIVLRTCFRFRDALISLPISRNAASSFTFFLTSSIARRFFCFSMIKIYIKNPVSPLQENGWDLFP